MISDVLVQKSARTTPPASTRPLSSRLRCGSLRFVLAAARRHPVQPAAAVLELSVGTGGCIGPSRRIQQLNPQSNPAGPSGLDWT